MTKNEEIKKVIFGLQFLKEKLYNGIFSDRLDCIDYAISAIKELQMYKDNKLCLVPEDVYSRQCCELDAYNEIGTVEECREAVEKQKAKKPDIYTDTRNMVDLHGNVYAEQANVYLCPTCESFIGYVGNNIFHYCPVCGQAIDEKFGGNGR